MNDDFYIISVSSLNIRKDPKTESRINLKKDTLVKETGKRKQYRKDEWIEIVTISEPIIQGYVNKKYLRKI